MIKVLYKSGIIIINKKGNPYPVFEPRHEKTVVPKKKKKRFDTNRPVQ